MAEISLAVNDVNIVKGIIVITLKEQLDFESIYLKHRKNDEKIACDYNVLDNKIFVKIEKIFLEGVMICLLKKVMTILGLVFLQF